MSNQLEENLKCVEILSHIDQQDSDQLSKLPPEVKALVLDYARLSSLSNRSEQQDDHIQFILESANINEILNRWIVKVDQILGDCLGLLDEDDRESYFNQQAWMREYPAYRGFPLPIDEQIQDYLSCPILPEVDDIEDDNAFCNKGKESSASQPNSPRTDIATAY